MKDFVPPAAANISNCGKVTIRKLTIPADQDQDFNYTSVLNREGTTGDNPAFKLNAKDTETDPDLKVPQNITFADVQVNASTNYSVTETLANFPAGWAFKSIDCPASNLDGAGGEPASELSKSGSTVTFQIDDASDVLDCTYTNEKPEGALLIKKQSTKTENPLVTNAGAVFSYDLNGGTGDPVEVTDDTTSAAPDEDADKGEVCVDGLTPGTYTVDEVSPPPGYGNIGTAADESVEVVGGTDCDEPAPPATDPIPGPTGNAVATFTNPPLGEITVQFRDLGSTETATSIVCHDSDPNTPALTPKDPSIAGDNDPGEDGDADPAFDDTNETFTNLPPGTYDCRVVVDP
jgi:hypothetical protein